MQELKIFHEAIQNPGSVALKMKEKKRKTIGYLCSYAPEELIYAAGFHPMRLFSSKAEINLAESHLQAYCCSLVRGILEDSLSGKLDYLDGTVFPHTCDSIQRLSDIWRIKTKYEFFADVIMPAKLNTQSAKNYMRDVLIKFTTDLEKACGEKITRSALKKSIAKFNLIKTNLKKLYELRSQNPGILKGADIHAIVKGSMIMDRDQLVELLPAIVSKVSDVSALDQGKRLVLSGSICDSPDIYDIIEQAGGVVVGDDLCTGQRWFDGKIPENEEPMEALTTRYFERIVCPAKHSSTIARGENIVKLAKQTEADGVIFIILKFCDPHGFDYPYMKEFLDKEGIKNILIEIDDHSLNSGQLSTRLETFMHMI
ncbi:MAG: 2-hydroxyacyl-CoA dehydratase family protein [Desulfobacteraceae bacterium]|nr:2-hydroxyacyl-CoA dehydratase family protein [Desulfobacteraceae bacterium]